MSTAVTVVQRLSAVPDTGQHDTLRCMELLAIDVIICVPDGYDWNEAATNGARTCMKLTRRMAWWILVALLAPLGAWQVCAANPESAFAGTWRIEVGGAAASDGSLDLTLTPRKQTPIVVSIAIKAGRPADGVARDIRAQLGRKLDRSAYKVAVERTSVVITAEMGTPRFELETDAAAAAKFAITLKRE